MTNKALKVLFIFNGVFVFAGSLLGPLYAVYVEQISKGIYSITFSWAAFLLSTTLFSLVVARTGDRTKEKEYLLLAGYAVRAVVWFSYLFIHDFYLLVFAQVMLGLGEAVGTPAYEALFAKHLDPGRSITEYSEWKVVSNIVLAVGTILGGLVVDKYGFSPLFLLMSTLAVISFVGILYKPRKLL